MSASISCFKHPKLAYFLFGFNAGIWTAIVIIWSIS